MTIEQIDNSKVLIVLGNNDMKDFSLEYNTLGFQDPHSRKILHRLLTLACTKAELPIKNKKMVVEALPHSNGCLILLTLKQKTKRKIYKIKKINKCLCCVFNNLDSLLSSIPAFNNSFIKPESSLYLYKEKYVLVFEEIKDSKSFLAKLREFSDKIVFGKISVAQVKEHGKVIIKTDAIATLGDYFN